MSLNSTPDKSGRLNQSNNGERILWGAVLVLLAALVLVTVAGLAFIGQTPLGQSIINALFATNTEQALWYVTRAAGLVAYLLLWFSTAWGLAVSSKVLDYFLHRTFTYDLHQFISLLAIGFTLLHVVVLLGDKYLPFSVAEILVPFLSPYRPVWVGIGVIGFYLTLLVSVTFYIRKYIGAKTFRAIHLLSFLAYIGATVHGIFSGTDSPLWTTEAMYAGTALVIVFLTAHWLVMLALNKLDRPATAPAMVDRRTTGNLSR